MPARLFPNRKTQPRVLKHHPPPRVQLRVNWERPQCSQPPSQCQPLSRETPSHPPRLSPPRFPHPAQKQRHRPFPQSSVHFTRWSTTRPRVIPTSSGLRPQLPPQVSQRSRIRSPARTPAFRQHKASTSGAALFLRQLSSARCLPTRAGKPMAEARIFHNPIHHRARNPIPSVATRRIPPRTKCHLRSRPRPPLFRQAHHNRNRRQPPSLRRWRECKATCRARPKAHRRAHHP